MIENFYWNSKEYRKLSSKIIINIINIVELKRIEYSRSRKFKRIRELLRRYRNHIMGFKTIHFAFNIKFIPYN